MTGRIVLLKENCWINADDIWKLAKAVGNKKCSTFKFVYVAWIN